jgi:uncharacterized protein YkwD
MTGIDVPAIRPSTFWSRPVFPRTRVALALAAVIALAGATVAAAAPRDTGAQNVVSAMPTLDAEIAAGINAARAQHGLARLRISAALRAAANAHSYEMARGGFFSHNSADGSSPWKRLARFYPSTGFRRWQVGETLLWSSPGVDAAQAVQDWLASPEHRAILLTASFREIGVSAVHATSASGDFNGDQITVVTADFGLRTR